MNWPALAATYNSDRDGDGVTTTAPGKAGVKAGDDTNDADATVRTKLTADAGTP